MHTPEDYKRVFAKPDIRCASPYFKVLARTNEKPAPRLGVVVSKKAIRHAVMRNKVKRLIRESFRTHQQILSGLDIVVLLRQEAMSKAKHISPRACLLKHWEELKGLCQKS